MTLSNFKLNNRNHRWIQKKGINSKFDSGLEPMDAISINDLYNHSKKPNIMVIVGKNHKKIVAVIKLNLIKAQKTLLVQHIKADVNNQGPRVGGVLLEFAEKIGKNLQCEHIILDAVANKVDLNVCR